MYYKGYSKSIPWFRAVTTNGSHFDWRLSKERERKRARDERMFGERGEEHFFSCKGLQWSTLRIMLTNAYCSFPRDLATIPLIKNIWWSTSLNNPPSRKTPLWRRGRAWSSKRFSQQSVTWLDGMMDVWAMFREIGLKKMFGVLNKTQGRALLYRE